MLSRRDAAQGLYREALSMGRGSVLGGDMTAVIAARLDRARRAERSIQAAFDAPRTGVFEPSDAVLTDMLGRVRRLVETLEVDAQAQEVRGGPEPL